MEYSFFDKVVYVRMDKGDEIISRLLELCKKEGIGSATFSGIGGCALAEIQTFIPETGSFETQRLSGMFELVSLTGNITSDDPDNLYHHTHAVFSYKDNGKHRIVGGHIKSVTVTTGRGRDAGTCHFCHIISRDAGTCHFCHIIS